MPRFKATTFLLSLATACVPATFAQSPHGAVPGSLNYVQGEATLNGQPISSSKDITQPQQLHAGDVLATTRGSADVLLAPGSLLRLGQDSAVHLVSADANRTEVKLDQGRANVDVNVIRGHDLVLVDLPTGQTQILKQGLYTFNAADSTVRVFNGEAYAFPGSDTTTNVKPVKVKDGKEVTFTGTDRPKAEDFDRELATDDVLPWTGPRETNAALADGAILKRNTGDGGAAEYAGFYPAGYGFYGPYAYAPFAYGYPYGWYGDPYGFWGGPFFGVGLGWYGGGYGYGYGGGHILQPVHHGEPVVGGGLAGRGFAGGARGFAGGGFHGGGGGFHGGGGRR